MNDITAQAILAAAAAEDAALSAAQAVPAAETAPTPAPEPVPARPSGTARRRKAQDDEAADADRTQVDEAAADSAGVVSGAAFGAAAGDWGSLPAASDLLAQATVPSTAAAAPTSAGTNAPDTAPSGPSLVEVLLGAVPLALVAAAADSDSDPAPAPAAPDTTPPRVSIDAPARSVSATPTVTGTTDLADGATVSIRLQRADGSATDYTVNVQGGQFSLPVPTALPEGSYTVTATAVDAAGNRATASDTGTVDLMTIDGTITAGPVVAGHGLTVTAYAADGSVLGSSPVAADGSYRIVLQQPYAGLLLVRVSDANTAADYRDEASGQAQDLTVDLRAVAQADGSQDLRVNVTPATELVVLGLGLAAGDGGNAAARLGQVSTAQVNAAQGAVQSALGLPDNFVSATVVPTVQPDGSANPQANVYGQVLAAISGLSVTQEQPVGTVLAGLQPEVGDGSVGRAAAIGLVGAAVVANASGTAVGNALGLSSADATAITSAWSAVVGATRVDGLAPSDADLAVLGVASPGTPQALALVVSAIQGSSEADVGSVAALNALAGAAANVVAAADGKGALTVQDLQALGVEGVTADNLDAVAHALVTLGVQNLPTNVEALAEVVQTVVQDTTGPALTVADTLGTDSGLTATVAQGGATRDSTVVVSGSVSDASGVASVRVFDGATLLGTAAVAADGSWRFTTPALSHGTHAINVQATDLAGNVSTSTSIAFTVDTVAPTVTVSAASLSNDTTPTISGTTTGLATGTTVTVEVVNAAGAVVATLNPEVGSDGRYVVDAPALGDGRYTVRVGASDAAGNSATAAQASITIDNVAPRITSAIVATADEGQAVLYRATATDEAFNPHGVTWTLEGADAGLLQIVDGVVSLREGVLEYDAAGSQRTYSFTVFASDGVQASSAAVNVTVNNLDDEAPTLTAFAAPVAVAAADNSAVAVTLAQLLAQGNEADDVAVVGFRVVAVNTANGTLKIGTDAASAQDYRPGENDTIDATRHAFWLPAEGSGLGNRDAFSVQAVDGANAASASAVQVQVQLVEPFTITFAGLLAEAPENAATLVATAGASAGAVGDITWTKEGVDADHFDIDANTGALTLRAQNYEQPADQGGNRNYQVTVRATDSRGVSATADYAVNLTDANDAATFGGDLSGEVTEGAGATVADALTITGRTATANDEDASDADGFQGGSYIGTYGTLTMQANGQWAYTVDKQFAAIDALLPTSAPLLDTVQVRAADGTPTDIVITIRGANDTPVAVDDGVPTAAFVSVNEDSGFTVIDVLANDTDAEGHAGLVVASASSTHGTVNIAPDGKSISFRPTADYFGPAAITYTVRDGNGTVSDAATVRVEVTALIDPAIVVNSVRVGGDLFINGTDDDATTLEVTGRIDGTAGSDFTVGQTVRVTTTDGMTHDGEVLDASGNFLVNVATASLIYRAPDADSAVDRELVVALMNPAGTTVAASLPVHYIVDTQAPSVDLMAASTTLNPSTGVVENNDTIAGSTVTLFFSADDTIEGTFVNVLQVYNHGVLLGNARLVATPDGTGNYWRYVASGLTTGDYSFTAVGTDMAGNRSDHSSAFTISVDRTAPVTAASDSASLYENSSLLYSVRNTDDAGDPVTWSLVPDVGDAGRLFLADRIEGGVVVGKEVRVSAGAVDYDNTTDFQTSYTFTLRGADALGNSTDKTVTIQVLDAAEFSVSDVTVGNDANPIVNAADLSGDHVRVTARLSGEFAGLGTGTAGEPIFFLSVGPDGDYLTGDDAAYTFDPSTGIVTFTHVPSALIQAHAELLVHAMVPVDHVGTTFDTSFQADTQHTYAVDTVAPGLEMLRFEDADGVDLLAATGPITVYRDAVDLAGLIGRPVQEATSRLAVWDNGVLVAQPAFDPGVGDWRLQLTDLTPGLHEVSVVFTDLAGNATTFTRSFTYEPDVAAPVITSPGTVNVTENNTFSHALAATDATRVSWQVMEVEGQQGSLFTVADGNRLVLKDGMPDYETRTTYTVTVRATDTSNNFVDQTISIHVGNEVESTSITSVAVTDAANVINLAEAALAGTPGATLAVSGHVTGEYRADDEVQVVANGTTYTGHVVAGGSFTVNVNAADLVASTLPDAAGGTAPGVTVTVQATGSDGTVAPVSVPQTFTFDTSVPTVTLDDLPDTVATRTVAVAGTVSGAAAGATVTVQVLNSADEVVATGTGTVAAGTGRFSADVTGLSGGDYHVVARVDNPAGNTGRSDPEPFEYSGFFIEASGPYGFATTMDENVAGYGVVLSARSDANPVGAEPTLAIEGGADASLFELVRSVPGDESSPWVLQFKPGVFGSGVTLPDYDVFAGADGTPADGGDNTFEVVVQATDALGAQVQQTITLALLDRGPVVLAMGGSAGDTSPLSQTDTDGFRMFTVRPNDSRTGNAADIAWANPQNQQAGWARKGEASDPDFPAYVESIPSSVEQTGAITADDGQGGSEVLLTMGTPSGFDGFRLTVALNPDAWAYRSLSAGQERVEHVDLWMAETGSDPLHAGEVSRLRTTWTIVGVNDAPEAHNATASVAAGVHENQATPVNLTYAQLLAVVGGTDVDGADDLAALRVVSVGLGTLRVDGTDYAAGSTLANLRITPTSTVQWVPGAANDANGPQTAFTVRAVDAAGLESADATVRVDLAADDDAPVVTGDRTGSISEDAAPTSGTRLQTTGVLTLTDVDGPPPTFDMGRTYEGNYGSLTFATDPASGGLRWTYTLNAAADRLVAAESVVDTIPVTLTSDVGQVFDIQVTVTGANDGPTIVATLKSDTIEPGGTNNGTRTGNTQSGNFLTGTYVGDVETGLTGLSITRIESVSADGSTTFGSAATPGITGTTLVGTYGAMVMSSTGAWTYTAGGLSANPAQPSGGTYLAKDEKASDYFRVTVTDPQGGHTTSIIQCEVTGRNDQPNLAFTPNATYASIDSPYVAGGGTVQLASAANFVDPDGLTQIRSLVLYSASEWDWNNDALVVNLPGTLATNFHVTQTGAEGIAAKGLTVEFVDTADRTAATNPPTNAEWAQVMQSIGFQSAEGGVAGERVFFFQVFDVEGSSRSISSAFVSIHVEATVSVGAEAPPEAAQPAPDGAGTEAGAGEPGTPAGTSGPGTSTPTDIDGLLAALASTDPAPADAASGPGTEPVYPDPFHYWRTPDSALLMV